MLTASPCRQAHTVTGSFLQLLMTGGLYITFKAIYDPLGALPARFRKSILVSTVKTQGSSLVSGGSSWSGSYVNPLHMLEHFEVAEVLVILTVISLYVLLNLYALTCASSQLYQSSEWSFTLGDAPETIKLVLRGWLSASECIFYKMFPAMTRHDMAYNTLTYTTIAAILWYLPRIIDGRHLLLGEPAAWLAAICCVCLWVLQVRALYLIMLPQLAVQGLIFMQAVVTLLVDKLQILLHHIYHHAVELWVPKPESGHGIVWVSCDGIDTQSKALPSKAVE